MIPNATGATTETARPIWPTTTAHTPKVMKTGTRLGTVLMRPSLKLLNTPTKIAEIKSNAKKVPDVMLSILRIAICENIIKGLAPCEAISGGAFFLSHS